MENSRKSVKSLPDFWKLMCLIVRNRQYQMQKIFLGILMPINFLDILQRLKPQIATGFDSIFPESKTYASASLKS